MLVLFVNVVLKTTFWNISTILGIVRDKRICFGPQLSPFGCRMSRKINKLLQNWPTNAVASQRWLNSQGVDRRLADKYARSGWLTRLGHGAYVRPGDTVDWPGGLKAIQSQLGLDVHPGGITAFDLRGYGHYIALGARRVTLFGAPATKLPAWFTSHSWSRPISLVTTRSLTQGDNATSTVSLSGVEIEVATLERAAFEMMYLVPKRQSYEEAMQVMESLTALRPTLVQQLLETCTSVKTKRLVMHAAERLKLPWISRIDLAQVDFGSGPRTIHPGGQLNKKYKLILATQDPQ